MKQGYKSANMAANFGNKLRKYIQEIASAAAAGKESAANISKETKLKDAKIHVMTTQIKTLIDAITLLTKSLANKENTPPNMGNMNSGTTHCTFHWMHNMGAYCWSHGHHSVRAKHTSSTCTKKKEGHIDDVTTTYCQGGNNFWPANNKVKESQHNHPSFKVKTAPTN